MEDDAAMPPVTRVVGSFVVAALVLAGWTVGTAAAQSPAPDAGLYISVPSPITTQSYNAIKQRIDAARAKPERRPRVIIFDFNPQDKDATTPDYGACADLAIIIADLRDTTTVAYVHAKVSGHSVLPALCCQQLVVGPKAVIGDVIGQNDQPLRENARSSYPSFIGNVRPSIVAVAKKMFDSRVELRRGKKGQTDWFVDLRDRATFPKDVVVTDQSQLPGGEDNKIGSFKAEQLRSLGIAVRVVESSRDLLDDFGLNPSVLKDDPLDGRTLVAYRYVLTGAIETGVKEAVDRVLKDMVRQNGNVLFLQLECAGGDLQAARELAEKLIEYQSGENPILIVAYIPEKAPDTAAIIALGCSQIVMSKRKDAPKVGDDPATEAEFGDFEAALGKLGGNLDFWVASLRELAEKQGYPPQLVEGMLRADIEIVQVRKKGNGTIRRLMTNKEFQEDRAKGAGADWVHESTVKPKGQLLKLSATQAEQYGLARHTVDNREPKEVYALYGVEPSKVKDAAPAWLDKFADFLKLPAVTVLLVVIGFTGLILELKVPGTTVPGIVAALCFILVFWAHTQFSGQVAVLAGLLFILGLILILMEVFVIPGFGVTGIIGVVFMLAALALVTFNDIPTTWSDAGKVGGKMATYMLGMFGSVGLAFLIARYLPNIPYANRLILTPPSEMPGAESEPPVLPGVALAASLLGAVGTAVTVLRPAGSVRFGEQFIDVVSDGGYIPAGVRVQVIEVEGTRIVVKEV